MKDHFLAGFALLLTIPVAKANFMPVPPPVPKVADVIVPAGRDINLPGGLPVHVLFDAWMREPAILHAPDGVYYLTGTTCWPGAKGAQLSNDGIHLWKSTDLVHWEPMGLIWSLAQDATWAKEWKQVRGDKHWRRAVWAPSLCYIKGTYWIPYSMNYYEAGLLKSTSGKPEGPYVDVKSQPLTHDIDAALFADDDGKVYYMWAAHRIALMKDDLSDLAEPPRDLKFANKKWGEGSHMYKINGKYLFTNAGVPKNNDPSLPYTYDTNAAAADSVYGPYTALYRAIPLDGHNAMFQDAGGKWWATFFGSDKFAPWRNKPSLMPVTIDNNDMLKAKILVEPATWSFTTQDPGDGAWMQPHFNDGAWSKGPAGFGNPAIMYAGALTMVNTPLPDLHSIWMRTTFNAPPTALQHPAFYLRNSGPVKIYLNGQQAADIENASDDYETVPLTQPELVHVGANTLAVQGTTNGSPAYFDVGLVNSVSR